MSTFHAARRAACLPRSRSRPRGAGNVGEHGKSLRCLVICWVGRLCGLASCRPAKCACFPGSREQLCALGAEDGKPRATADSGATPSASTAARSAGVLGSGSGSTWPQGSGWPGCRRPAARRRPGVAAGSSALESRRRVRQRPGCGQRRPDSAPSGTAQVPPLEPDRPSKGSAGLCYACLFYLGG